MGAAESAPAAAFAPAGDDAPVESSSLWGQFRESYDEIVAMVIRPPRAEYHEADLGPRAFSFGGRAFRRSDFSFPNSRGHTLAGSHWHPSGDDEAPHLRTPAPCVVFLHSHVSARVDATTLLRSLLSAGLDVIAFDFAGHGHSEGDTVSLGWFERDDVHDLVEYLRAQGHTGGVALWGHYTGAAAALLHADRDPAIAALVLEGAAADAKTLVLEWAERGRSEGVHIPAMVVSGALRLIRRTVRTRAGYDVFALRPIDHVSKSFAPALFVVAEDDVIVQSHHGRELQAKYAGDSNLITVPGDHASTRPQFLLDSAVIFLSAALRIDPPEVGPDPAARAGVPPWVTDQALWVREHGLGRGGGAVRANDSLSQPQATEEAMVHMAVELSLADGRPTQPSEATAAGAGDDDDEDEDLKRALALSLADTGAAGAHAEETLPMDKAS